MNKSKLFMAVMISAITIPAMVASVPADANEAAKVGIEQQVAQTTNAVSASAVKTFKDVSKNSPYYDIINEMAKLKIISGYEDGTFRPNEVITRKHAAALVNRGKKLPETVKFVKFKDVSENSANFNDIKALQQAGIFAPDAKGNFNPNKALSRAEMAKVLVIAYDLKVKSVHNFPDVPTSHASSKYVQALYSNGITTGNDGKFLPNDSLTRANYAVFMHRAMNMDDSFVAPPIGKPTTPPVVKPDPKPDPTPGTDTGLITDKYKSFLDVPLPKGTDYVSIKEKQEKEYGAIRVREVHNWTGSFSTYTQNKDSILESSSKQLGVTKAKLISLVNDAVKTGNVYDGGSFSLYYSFDKGNVVISGRNN